MNESGNTLSFNTVIVQQEPFVELHYAQMNPGDSKKPLIVFLHGFGEYWYAWNDIIPDFKEQGYHVVAPDLRGFHKSSKPKAVKNYDIKFLVRDIKRFIKNFNKEKVIVVGHDWGGAITWKLADQHPELVSKIVVLNSPHRGAYAKNIRKSIFVNLKQSLRSWYIYFFQLPFLPEIALKAFDFKWAEYNFRG